MRKTILEEKMESEFKDLSVEELREVLAEQDMKIKALDEQKKLLTKGFNSLIKQVKEKRGEVLEILEAKDSVTARKVLTEITRK